MAVVLVQVCNRCGHGLSSPEAETPIAPGAAALRAAVHRLVLLRWDPALCPDCRAAADAPQMGCGKFMVGGTCGGGGGRYCSTCRRNFAE